MVVALSVWLSQILFVSLVPFLAPSAQEVTLSVCLSVRYKVLSRSVYLHLSLSGLSKIWFRSGSGLFRLSLSAFLAYCGGQTEPKILRLDRVEDVS